MAKRYSKIIVGQKNKGGIKHSKKQLRWLAYFLDETNKRTFMNNTESAKAAGYKSENRPTLWNTGAKNNKKFRGYINNWLDEAGYSEECLKQKLIKLTKAKETKHFAHQGKVVDTKKVAAHNIRLQSIGLAMKAKGMFAPQEVRFKGKQELEYKINKESLQKLGKEELEALAEILTKKDSNSAQSLDG